MGRYVRRDQTEFKEFLGNKEMKNQYAFLSTPEIEFNDELYDSITITHFKEQFSTFLNKNHLLIRQHSTGLFDFLNSITEINFTRKIVSGIATGRLYDCLSNREDTSFSIPIAALLALWIHSFHYQGNWKVTFGNYERLYFAEWILPLCKEIEVNVEEKFIELKLSTDQGKLNIQFEFINNEWYPINSLPIDHPLMIKHELGYIIFISPQDYFKKIEELKDFTMGTKSDFDELQEYCNSAFIDLEKYFKPYFHWVIRKIRYIIPTRKEKDRVHSGSITDHYNLIHLSPVNTIGLIAESLVHEAAHLYYNTLHILGPLVDGSDTNMYFSPPVQTLRRVDKILFAFHAFANIYLLGQRYLKAGIELDYWEYNLETLLPDLKKLSEPLEDNKSLTEFGRAIFEPLYERVFL